MTTNWFELAQEEGFYKPPVKTKRVQPRSDLPKTHKPEDLVWSEDQTKFWVKRRGGDIEFRQIPSYRSYYISNDQSVKNIDGYTLSDRDSRSGLQVRLRVGIKEFRVYKLDLLFEAWPELGPVYHDDYFEYNGELWKPIKTAPTYAISTRGSVIKLKNFVDMRVARGMLHMSINKKQVARSINRLCLETWGSLPER